MPLIPKPRYSTDDESTWPKMGYRQPGLRRGGPGRRAGGVRAAGRRSWCGGGLEGCQVVGNGGGFCQLCGGGGQCLLSRLVGNVLAASRSG